MRGLAPEPAGLTSDTTSSAAPGSNTTLRGVPVHGPASGCVDSRRAELSILSSRRSLCFLSARAKSRKSCKSGSNYRETLDPISGRNMGLFLWTGSAPKGCSLTLAQLTQQLLSLSSQHEQHVTGLKPGSMSCTGAAPELPALPAHSHLFSFLGELSARRFITCSTCYPAALGVNGIGPCSDPAQPVCEQQCGA